jgi:hypothetical protein
MKIKEDSSVASVSLATPKVSLDILRLRAKRKIMMQHRKGVEARKNKFVPEARDRGSEFSANLHLAGIASRKKPGFHLMRDGQSISHHGSTKDALDAYKKLKDNKGVKIVHVKESVDKTKKIKEKVKKAVDKIILSKKKVKDHVNVEPVLAAGKGNAIPSMVGDEPLGEK